MRLTSLIFLLAWVWAAPAALAQISTGKVFETTDGIRFSTDAGLELSQSIGSVDPSQSPGVDAPLYSIYYQSNGDVWKKTGIAVTDWELQGLNSAVVTQTADFGTQGNASSNSFLNRAGGVSSNLAGIAILVSSGTIRSVVCASEDIDTYDVEIYEHEGDFTNPVLKHTLSVVASRSGIDTGLSVSVTQGNQIAAKVLDAVKNPTCTVGMKGLSL